MKKSTKKGSKSAKSSGTAKKRAAAPSAALTTRDKQRLLKPHRDYATLVDELIQAWTASGRAVRLGGLTPGKLRSMLRAAQRADAREQDARRKAEEKLRPLGDRRMLAEHALWKAVLDVNAVARAIGRSDPSVAAKFDFLTKALTSRRAPTAQPTPTKG